MQHARKGWKPLALMLALALLLAPTLHVVAAYAAAPAVEDAQKLYDNAKFAEAVVKLRDALGSGQVIGSDALGARALMARCLVKAGNRLEAKQAFKTVLRSDPAWRPDAMTVPPDEMDVFNLALKEIQAEQIEAGQRIPASLSFMVGMGSGKNEDFAKLAHAGGGPDKFDGKTEFGGSVRFPLKPRWSLDLELMQLSAEVSDSFVVNPRYGYEATATPVVLSLYWTAMTGSKHRVYLFGGAGPMLATRAAIKLKDPDAGYFVADEGVGFYLHAGAEGEWMVSERLAVMGRLLGRSASKKSLFGDTNEFFTLYSGPDGRLRNQDVSFSGFGAHVGLRAYIGY